MAPHNVVVIYKEWVNSILCEDGIEIRSISQLNTQGLFLRLYQLLTLAKNEADLNLSDLSIQSSEVESITILLRLLRADGVRTSLQPSDIASGDFQYILELLWLLILNYGIHVRGECPSHQRTTSIGTKLLLKWCSELLGGACFDYRLSMTENMEKDVLHNIINQVTNMVSKPDEPEPCDYHEAIADAERKLGVSSNLLRACDTETENLAVTVYISLLRRKRELLLVGSSPARTTILVNQQPQFASERPRSNLSMHNDKTQQVLKDIEKQLDIYHNGFAASSPRVSNGHEVSYNSPLKHQSSVEDSRTGSVQSRVPSTNSSGTILSSAMPSPIARAHGSFPDEPNGNLKLDLSTLQQSNKMSCSTSTTPQKNGVSVVEQTADFTALLRQLREQKRSDSDTEAAEILASGHPDKYEEDEDDRTSPKSAPNTDEGFGTFTKTTPRGKDSASEGSDDHTDCDVDHLTPEPGSITEWWDRIEMPSIEVTAVDSSLFKTVVRDQSLTRLEEGGSMELADDELMCMIDTIGMSGIKATSGLASAQEMELRLLYILKERDDLVLSYHGALKELSKLTARIKDENHLLRQQLNMTDLSHNEIVLALEEQASNGRKLALGLQDDLTDTEVNILSRLREDKAVLEDRLAAVEHQYNTDLNKWQSDISAYQTEVESSAQQEAGEIMRENDMLKSQLKEMKTMFDVTVSQTQDECGNYLLTIDKLKQEICEHKSPINEAQLEALATRQAEMERLYQSMVNSLEGDNVRLQSELEELQEQVVKLKLGKAKLDKCSGTTNHVSDSGMGTDCTELINRSMNTSLSQSSKGTATSEVKMAVKSTVTDDDAELVALKQQVVKLEGAVTQGSLNCDTLQEQKSGLLDNHKQLSERLADVESQLQITRHTLTTLQAVHEIVLTKNETMGRELADANNQLTAESASKNRLHHQLSSELERACSQSSKLSSEVTSTRQQLISLQAECAGYRQREVSMNSELTKLTLERSNLQSKVNSLNSDLVNQKAQHVSQSMKVQQLEATKANMESQLAEFKQDSMELCRKLEEVRQEKDDMSQQLSSLHSQLSQSVADWKIKLSQQSSQHQQVKSNLESELGVAKSAADQYKSETERLTLELGELRGQLRGARDTSDKMKGELSEVLRTAKLDQSTDDVIGQLHDKLKALLKETAEYRFTTTHFRSENGQLQLRVNQLEEMNKSIEERNKILQAEVSAVQASLDDSYTSADAQLNLLDLSAADLMSIDDASQLRNYILAAKRQVEMMQSKRAQSNIEYSRKIFEMEKLVKDKNRSSSEVLSIADSVGDSSATLKSTSDYRSTSTDYAKLPDHLDTHNSTLAASLQLESSRLSGDSQRAVTPGAARSQQVLGSVTPNSYNVNSPYISLVPANNYTYPAATTDTKPNLTVSGHPAYHSDTSQQVPISTDTIYLQPSKLRYIPPASAQVSGVNNPPRTSENVSKRSLAGSQWGPQTLADISDIELSDGQDSLSLKVQTLTNRPGTSTPTRISPQTSAKSYIDKKGSSSVKISAIESENAALKAELDVLNSDRSALHHHMEKQSVQHDVLNSTLDELERSLEEVCDSNKLLRNTLGDCNNFIQTNILSEPASSLPNRSRQMDLSTRSRTSLSERVRPHSVAPVTRPHSVTPSARSHSMATAVRPHSKTPSRTHYASDSLVTPHSVRIGGTRTSKSNQDSLGWSSQSDRQLTSSYDFNKLQQTNVNNYSSLLHSDTNYKSPSNQSAAERKSTDLNHMIQHSLSRLNQVNAYETSSPTLSSGFTSTPVKSSARGSAYNSSAAGQIESETTSPYITANQDTVPSRTSATPPLRTRSYHPPPSHHSRVGKGLNSSYDSHRSRQSNHHLDSSSHWDNNSSYPVEHRTYGSRSTSPYVKIERAVQSIYDDGGPGPNEPKAVLPEPP